MDERELNRAKAALGGQPMAPTANYVQPREIGWAVKQMWHGQAVTRAAWYGKHKLQIQRPDAHSKMTEPYVYITTQRGELIPWLASQADLLATDWKLFEVE